MIGIFDSGKGGLFALSELRHNMPSADICFYADKENAPYGTKSETELTRLVKRDIEILKSEGAEVVLMACCTASTVYHRLSNEEKSICCPIILPTAKSAANSIRDGKVAVIATERTVKSHAFRNALHDFDSECVLELSLGELVALIENGISDSCIDEKIKTKINSMLLPVRESGASALILGCTHFAYVEKTVSELLPGIRIINSAREGALEIKSKTKDLGSGRTFFL